jgi:hypothetical protein
MNGLSGPGFEGKGLAGDGASHLRAAEIEGPSRLATTPHRDGRDPSME